MQQVITNGKSSRATRSSLGEATRLRQELATAVREAVSVHIYRDSSNRCSHTVLSHTAAQVDHRSICQLICNAGCDTIRSRSRSEIAPEHSFAPPHLNPGLPAISMAGCTSQTTNTAARRKDQVNSEGRRYSGTPARRYTRRGSSGIRPPR